MSESVKESDEIPDRNGLASLGYASPDAAVRRPIWVYACVAIYLAAMASLPALPYWLEWDLSLSSDDVVPIVCIIAVFVGCGLALMMIPIRTRRRRPVSRRSIWVPILASGLLAGVLLFGGGAAFCEFISPYWSPANSRGAGWAVVSASAGVWIGWCFLFGAMMRRQSLAGVGLQLHRWLIAGSLLELIVAVPCHIIVRRRSDCCGGIGTGIGICIGVAVALLAFGPAVFLLFYVRGTAIAKASPRSST